MVLQQQEITVRRAKPGDAGRIAAFVNHAWQGRLEIDEMTVIERLGSVGFLLAERDDTLVGMLGWQAENLVVRLTDFLVRSVSERLAVGQALLAEMDRAAGELQCEVSLLFLPRPAPPALVEFYMTLGYEPQVVADLPKAWQEAAREGQLEDYDTVLVKRLREDRVFRPM
jgi:N-acetylglutamate synthase-like GNAT family acetyltransferase